MSARRIVVFVLIFGALLVSVPNTSAAEPLADTVRKSIDGGIRYLKSTNENRGGQWSWENAGFSLAWKGGTTCLATLALLTSGEKANDGTIEKTLPYIRGMKPEQTYVIALQTMVLAEVGEARDKDIIQRNVDWLLAGRYYSGNKLKGWSYGKNNQMTADNSNSQYALLGLLAGRHAGIKIPQKDWEEIQQFYVESQVKVGNDMGGWPYRPDSVGTPSQTMTLAGAAGLYITGLEQNIGKQKIDEDTGFLKDPKLCGVYDENEALGRAMRWLGQNFNFTSTFDRKAEFTFYNIYGIERVGRLSGQRFIGKHDWYREGCEALCGVHPDPNRQYAGLKQHEDGSWRMGAGIDSMPVLSTSFALLFLSKGRTPILMSKLAFDGMDANAKTTTTDWNRKHHDARHMVEYASRAIFKNQPLAWQIFDPRSIPLSKDQEIKEELTNLLQAPILYMNGHTAPKLTAGEIDLLKRYVDEGGFIFAEACCGSEEFIVGFRKLMEEVFKKESQLTPMRADHPIWTAHIPINPAKFMEGKPERLHVQCIERGCKTVVVFSPQPLAGFWEESRFMPEGNLPPEKRGELAYRFAGNVIAYATGLEMPKPRLSKVELSDQGAGSNVTRHVLKLFQMRHVGDWQPAPQAMRNLANYLREQYKLDVAPLNTAELMENKPGQMNLFQYKFMYMHGRRDFTMDEDELKNIRANLRTGGLIFADACCGSREFDRGFREFARKLYPDRKLEPILLKDDLFSESLNGRAITTVKGRREHADGKATLEYEDMAPELEGIKVGNRWVVIYSKYDIGCALEKAKSSACLGYDHESAKLLGAAAVLYVIKR
jgi:hypothetical protein